MTQSPALLWFRDDLRLSDNPALLAARERGPLLCLYVFDDAPERRPLGGASRWWLSRSLKALSRAIAEKGGRMDEISSSYGLDGWVVAASCEFRAAE